MVDPQSQMLRLLLWFEVDKDKGVIDTRKIFINKRERLDFGDKTVSVVTEIASGQYCVSKCKTPEGRFLLERLRYADNMGGSLDAHKLDAKALFRRVKTDMTQACLAYGF